MMSDSVRNPGSFRDPSGYIFRREGRLFRRIQAMGNQDYRLLVSSGLYQTLCEQGLLVEHREVPGDPASGDGAVLEVEELAFFSYPYEWTFSQLKDAALLTLRVLRIALEHGMILKDASAFNISFSGQRPVFVDIQSFTRYQDGQLWNGYRQFCEHFLLPLALMTARRFEAAKLLKIWIDGLPLSQGVGLLPLSFRLRPSIALHLVLHERAMQRHSANAPSPNATHQLDIAKLRGLVENLQKSIDGFRWRTKSQWTGYYDSHSYSTEEENTKLAIVRSMLLEIAPRVVWDIGCNTGRYSDASASVAQHVVAMDADHDSVERMYLRSQQKEPSNISFVTMDFSNPSARVGWAHQERASLEDRGPADALLYLAVIHHMRFTHNIPLIQQAEYLSRLCRYLIIEWIAELDPMVLDFVSLPVHTGKEYNLPAFEEAFRGSFDILRREEGVSSTRGLYLMKSRYFA